MTAPARFLVLVIALIVAAVALMAPRRDEWLAVLNDEGDQARIISLLQPRLARSPDDPVLLGALAHAYAETHNYSRGIELLRRYTAIRPKDTGAYAFLADLYAKTGNITQAITMLQPAIAIKPALPHIMALASLYYHAQEPDKELALLSRFEAKLTLQGGLLLRLAQLRATVGDREGAIRALMRPQVVSAWSEPAENAEPRLLLAGLLVQSGQSQEAVNLGKHWILQWQEPYLANRLLRAIVLRAPVGDASELADAVAALHPEIRLFLVHELAADGARPVARHLLETWEDANPSPSTDEIAAFLTACREQDEPGIVWQTFGEVISHSRSSDVIAHYIDAIQAEFGIGALAPFWPKLPRGLLEHRPLMAARLAFHEGHLAAAKWLLEKADLRVLAPSDHQAWIDLFTLVTSPPEAFNFLREERHSGRLPPDLLVRYARLAGTLGQEAEYRAAVADLTIDSR
jgi:tetratricopeptide (TPR) repeat protein